MRQAHALALLLVTLLSSGCESGPAAAHDHSHQGEDPVDDLERVFEAATTDFVDEVSEVHASGWPESVRLGRDGKPQVRFGELRNLTAGHADMRALQDRLTVALTEQDVVFVRATEGLTDEVALVITGTVESEESRSDGATRKTTWVALRLIEPGQGEIVAATRTMTKVVRER